jgi:uncharacterized membrane protein
MTEENNVVDPNVTSDDKLWALLSYLFTPLIPIILLLIEDKKNRPFLKAHYPQALAWGVVMIVISLIPILGWIVAFVGFIMNIIWGIKAFNGEYVKIPVLTDFVAKQGWSS